MKANFFKKISRPPHYLSMKAAGIDIRNQSIRYMEFADTKKNSPIKNFGQVLLLPNTIKDGEIINKSALVKALSEVKMKISSDFVRISIPEEKTYIFDTQIPISKGSNIRESIEFKLEENVPLKTDEVFFEYDVIKKEERNGTGNMLLSVSAIPKKTIENFSEACILAGLTPISFEMESRMMAQSVIPKGDMRNFLIINIKEDSTLLSLVVSGVVRFTSTTLIGDMTIKENLSKTNPSLSSGKIPDVFLSSNTSVDKELLYSLANVFSAIRDEITKFNEYLLSKSEGKGILLPKAVDEIILCGRSSALSGFAGYINKNTDAKVTLANVWTNVFNVNDRLPRITFQDSLDFPTAIGLAIS